MRPDSSVVEVLARSAGIGRGVQGASLINKAPRTNLKSVLGHFLRRA